DSIGVDAAGDFVVAWESTYQDGSYSGVFAQRICVDNNSNSTCDSAEATTTTTSTTTTTLPTLDCGASPATGCLTGAKASFAIKDSTDDTKDKLKWKLSKGDAFDQ